MNRTLANWTGCVTPELEHGGPESGWLPYNGSSNDHRYLRKRCGMLCNAFNNQPLSVSLEERKQAWNDLTSPNDINGVMPEAPLVRSPFYVDYGVSVHVAASAIIDRGCYFQDCPIAAITIGEGTWIGPGVHISCIKHEVDWRNRDGVHGPAWTAPVTIGDDCHIGSHVTIMSGVTIGDGCVVGAGAVVTKSIPAYHVAYGNPARPVRKVAPDVPDGPDLQYEQHGKRLVVVEPHVPAAELRKMLDGADKAMVPAKEAPNQDDAAEKGEDEGSRAVTTASASAKREKDGLIKASESLDGGTSGMIGIDVFLLVMALLIAWLIMHMILY